MAAKGKKTSPVPSGKFAAKTQSCSAPSGCAFTKLFKYLFYSVLVISASSQIAYTRPYYEVYAEPYYNQYLKVSN